MSRKRKANNGQWGNGKKSPSQLFAEERKSTASALPSTPNGNRIGRPTIYSEELASEICARLSEGNPLETICAQEDMPSKSTVMRWLFDEKAKKAGFWDIYDSARKAQAESLVDEIISIADDADIEMPAAVNKARCRIDARRYAASVFNRSRFGDKPHVAIQNNQTIVAAEDPRELARRLALALTDVTPSD